MVRGPIALAAIVLLALSLPSSARADAMASCTDATLDAASRLAACERARQSHRAVLREDPSDEVAREGCRAVLLELGYDAEEIARSLDHACARIRDDAQDAEDARTRLRADLAAAGITEPVDLDVLHFKPVDAASEEANRLLVEAVTHAAEGDIYGAASAYSQAGKLDPLSVRCNTGEQAYLMRLYDASVRPEAYGDAIVPRTLEELDVVLLADPTDPGALRERALILAAVKAWEPALANLALALVSDPRAEEIDVLVARLGLALQDRLLTKQYNAVISGDPIPGMADTDAFYGWPLELIESARDRGAEGAFVEVTWGQALLAVVAGKNDVERYNQARHAFDLALTYVPDPASASELEVWSAAAALSERQRVKFALDDATHVNDMLAVGDLPFDRFRPGCPKT